MNDLNKHFDILGLKPNATRAEIRAAYKEMIMVWHPDRFPQDSSLQGKALENTKRINAAYECLKNYEPPTQRQSHNEFNLDDDLESLRQEREAKRKAEQHFRAESERRAKEEAERFAREKEFAEQSARRQREESERRAQREAERCAKQKEAEEAERLAEENELKTVEAQIAAIEAQIAATQVPAKQKIFKKLIIAASVLCAVFFSFYIVLIIANPQTSIEQSPSKQIVLTCFLCSFCLVISLPCFWIGYYIHNYNQLEAVKRKRALESKRAKMRLLSFPKKIKRHFLYGLKS